MNDQYSSEKYIHTVLHLKWLIAPVIAISLSRPTELPNMILLSGTIFFKEERILFSKYEEEIDERSSE